MRVVLYGKPGCCLCDELEAMLQPHLVDRDNVELIKRDITTNDAWLDAYRFRIPVLVIDGRECLDGRVEQQQVDDLFARLD